MSTAHKNLSDFSHLDVTLVAGKRYGIVVSQWNAEVTGKLLDGAVNLLEEKGVQADEIRIVHVPGSYELISGADLLLTIDPGIDAVICLGCVIQGETRHFDFICSGVAHGLAHAGLKHSKPVIFGVLTTDTEEQAHDRAGGKHGNKGEEAAITAIQMTSLF